uniref:L domain-like protein n=1 Tax=Arcella intermedia TaxID=1963864 RepID=A0A6B2L3Y3_9EUKA
MISLLSLDFSNNKINGEIPYNIGRLTKLNYFNMANNQLTGFIPQTIGSLSQLNYLDFSNNNISGEIPQNIGSLAKMNFINMGNNQLTGFIPLTIGNLSQLNYLNASFNSLSGPIPPTLSALTAYVDLSFNQFTGTIPNSLHNFKLQWLDLSSNNIVGNIPNISQSDPHLYYLSNGTIVPNYGLPIKNQYSLSCGVIVYDCDCTLNSKCFVTCSTNNTEFTKCYYPCPNIAVCHYVVLENLEGYAPIFLNDFQEILNISNSQIQVIEDIEINTLQLINSSIAFYGSFSIRNLNLDNSNIFLMGTNNIIGANISFSGNSLVICYGPIQISNSTFIMADTQNQSRQLILFHNSQKNIDTNSIVITFISTPQYCYHQKSLYSLFISMDPCESSDLNPPVINPALIGGIAGGVLGFVVLVGLGICIWSSQKEKKLLSRLSTLGVKIDA